MPAKPKQMNEALSPDEVDPAYAAAISEARAEVDAGKTISYEKIRAWLLSWGSKDELSPPECE